MQIEIPDKEILECTSAKGALRLSLDRSPNSLKAVAIDLGITDSHLSRALNSHYDVTLRHDLIVPFMASCGNAVYLRWLFLRLKELLPELDRHSRTGDIGMIGGEIEELKLVLRETVEEIKKAKAAKPCHECGAMFALSAGHWFVPAWLVQAALWVEWEIERDLGRVA